MEYNEIPTVIKSLNSENTQIAYAMKHDIERYKDNKSCKIKVSIGDRLVYLDAGALSTFLGNQMSVNSAEIERLEGIHDTLTKVAVGLIK